ncbi:MAG: tRNA (adenosine(37)-N6)-dimethylallyltransferase MiaA [bacterium]|nr:tRNA (adenosine(37)-N6)-dimethylallyltransferase MiaA [bacterium]
MKITVITGQTATGKTKLALELATKYNGELINCDSRQIYTSLNIITGKDISPTSTFHSIHSIGNFELGYYKDSASPIWLYDIVHPDKSFSAYDFKTCCVWVIKDIIQRGKIPILVGGTYFYLQNLLYDTVAVDIPPNEPLRKELKNQSVTDLQSQLKQLDSLYFESLNNSEKYNPQRLIRKIEILKSRLSQQSVQPDRLVSLSEQFKNVDFMGLRFGNKEKLEEAIRKRVDKRLREGAIGETESILKDGHDEHDPGLRTIGYQQIIQYLKGAITKDKAIEEWITKEIQYAKRQYTFMKKDANINWREV